MEPNITIKAASLEPTLQGSKIRALSLTIVPTEGKPIEVKGTSGGGLFASLSAQDRILSDADRDRIDCLVADVTASKQPASWEAKAASAPAKGKGKAKQPASKQDKQGDATVTVEITPDAPKAKQPAKANKQPGSKVKEAPDARPEEAKFIPTEIPEGWAKAAPGTTPEDWFKAASMWKHLPELVCSKAAGDCRNIRSCGGAECADLCVATAKWLNAAKVTASVESIDAMSDVIMKERKEAVKARKEAAKAYLKAFS